MKPTALILTVAAVLLIAAAPALAAKKTTSVTPAAQPSDSPSERATSKSPELERSVPVRGADSAPADSSRRIGKQTTDLPGTSPEVTAPSVPSTPSSSPADIVLDWVSVNNGGAIDLASGDIRMGVTVAQPVAGEVSTGDLKMGLGFWYGAGAGGGGGCSCPSQVEYDNDGFPTSLDLGWLIDIVFGGFPEVHDPGCPVSRGDFDFDGFPTTLDVAWMIDYVFGGGPGPCDPCDPVQPACAE